MASDFRKPDTRWLGQDLTVMESVGSTNQVLRERLKQGHLAPGSTVIAREQTAGRGRLGRVWQSPAGQGLYTSVLVYPPPARYGGILSLLAGVALSDAVRRVCGVPCGLKWPNDGVIGGKKYAGILVEAGSHPEIWAVIGMGVNVRGTVPEEMAAATTLARAAGQEVDPAVLWLELAKALETRYEQWVSTGDHPVAEAWRAVTTTVGQMVVVSGPGGGFTGKAVDIDDSGALLVEGPAGVVPVSSGEVSVRLTNGDYTA